MASKACATLIAMADTFAGQSRFAAAIKCLEAAVLCREVPSSEVKCLAKLARLLLDHTYNVTEARSYLERARTKVDRSVPLPLHLEVLSLLARCQRAVGEPRLYRQTADAGLAAVEQKGDAVGNPDMLRWHVHFGMAVADAHAAEGNGSAASSAVDATLRLVDDDTMGGEAGELKVLLLLFHLQLLLARDDALAAAAALPRLDASVTALRRDASARPQLMLHYHLLRLAHCVAEGHHAAYMATEKQGEASSWTDLRAFQVAVRGQGREVYRWMSRGCVEALLSALAARLMLTVQPPKAAEGVILDGVEWVEEEMAALGIGEQLSLECEPCLDGLRAREMSLPVLLRCSLMEAQATMHLSQGDLEGAAPYATGLLFLHQTLPAVMAPFVATTHMVAGHYCVLAGEYSSAVSHFERAAAVAAGSPHSRRAGVAAACCGAACLAGAAATGAAGVEALVRAEALLAGQGLQDDAARHDMAAPEKALALFASGCMRVARGDGSGAKMRLTKALKLAHAQLAHQQMVTQLLVLLAQLQVERGDTEGALNMLHSAHQLAKHRGDLSTMAHAARELAALQLRLGMKEDAQVSEKRAEEAWHEWQGILAAARRGENHATIVGWKLS